MYYRPHVHHNNPPHNEAPRPRPVLHPQTSVAAQRVGGGAANDTHHETQPHATATQTAHVEPETHGPAGLLAGLSTWAHRSSDTPERHVPHVASPSAVGQGSAQADVKTRTVNASNDADRSIPQPPFFEYRARKANPNGPSKVANDIRSHLDPKHGSAYEDRDPATAVHETTHGINSDVRNAKGLPGQGRVNGFYVGGDKAIRLTEPTLDLRKAKEFLPPSLQSGRSRMYVDQQQQWNDRPLYLLDELTAYTNGGAAATELAKNGQWNQGARDGVAGQLHFTPINMAMAMAIDKHDPSYFQNHPETKDYYGWSAMRAMDGFREGKDIPQFKGFGQEEFLRNFQSSPDVQPMRDFIKKTWGQEFHDRLLFGPQAVDTSKPSPAPSNDMRVNPPSPAPSNDMRVNPPSPAPSNDTRVTPPGPAPSNDTRVTPPGPAPSNDTRVTPPAPAPAPVSVGGRPGQQAPEIKAQGWINADGTPSLGARKGDVSVVEFWAPWCGPCRAQVPHMNEMAAKYKDQGLQIMALTGDSNSQVSSMARNMNYTVGYGSRSNADYGVSGIPHAVVVGRDGKVAWSGHPGTPEFEKAVQKALAAPRPAIDNATVTPKPAPPIDKSTVTPKPTPPIDNSTVTPKPAPPIDNGIVTPKPAPPTPAPNVDPVRPIGTVKREDGSYTYDAQGRLTQSNAADGSLRREYKYEDPADPNRITSLTLNGTLEFRRRGDSNWSATERGPNGSSRSLGDWNGELALEQGDVLRIAGANDAQPRHRGALARDLSANEQAARKGGDIPSNPNPTPKPAPIGGDGAQALTNTVRTDDGSYTRDDQGRIIEMRSNDGTVGRKFTYGDRANPNRVTQETLADGTTYKHIGPVKVNGQQMSDQGIECNSWARYDANGRFAGNWYGARSVSANGVYSARDIDRESSLTHSLADGKTISEADRQRRNAEGIWPNKADITRKDGRRIEAQLEGSRLNGLRESFPASGNDVARQVNWKRDANGRWQSDEQPARVRQSMDLLADGSLRYVDDKNQRVIEHGDGSREVTADGVTRAFGADNALTRVVLNDGRSRSFDYKDGKLASVTDTDKGGRQTWTREGDTNEFATPGIDHKRQINGSPNADGSYDYISCNGEQCEQKSAKVGDAHEKGDKGLLELPGIDGVVGPGTDNKINPQPPVDGGLPAEAAAAQKAFADAATQAGLDPKRLEGYMADFAENAKKYGYSADQITRTFNNLNTLLTSSDKSPIYSPDQRKTLVETAMHNIARPTEIDQGYHPTCNVTTLEIYSAARHPDEYSRLVKEVGLTGSWKTAAGDTVTPPANALKPGDDETKYDLDKPSSGVRNLASQVMEMTLINGTYQTGGKGDKWKDRSYVMDKISWQRQGGGSVKIGEDRIADRNGRPLNNKDAGPDFSQDDIVTASKMMLGKDNAMPYLGAPYSVGGGPWKYDQPSSQRLLGLKADGKFPLGVSTMGGAHVQTIHDVKVGQDGKTYVKLDNQHGAEHDGWVTLADLHRTMRTGVELSPSVPFDKVPD